MIYRELYIHISTSDNIFITWLVTWGHVSRVSPVSRDNVSHVMSWAGAGHWSAFVRCLHYTLSLFVRNIEHRPHATSNSLKLNMFRQKGEYCLDLNETGPQWSNERAHSGYGGFVRLRASRGRDRVSTLSTLQNNHHHFQNTLGQCNIHYT